MRSFGNKSDKEKLEYMLYLKRFFGEGEYEVKNTDIMKGLLYYRDFDENETALVYELFDYER